MTTMSKDDISICSFSTEEVVIKQLDNITANQCVYFYLYMRPSISGLRYSVLDIQP